MAKRRRSWNEKTYRKFLAEGRGQGDLFEYKPWIYIQDFPSRGMVSRVHGIKTNRVHHLLSKLENGFDEELRNGRWDRYYSKESSRGWD